MRPLDRFVEAMNTPGAVRTDPWRPQNGVYPDATDRHANAAARLEREHDEYLEYRRKMAIHIRLQREHTRRSNIGFKAREAAIADLFDKFKRGEIDRPTIRAALIQQLAPLKWVDPSHIADAWIDNGGPTHQ